MIEEADYVVCGGGSAGCVTAARLSEDPEQARRPARSRRRQRPPARRYSGRADQGRRQSRDQLDVFHRARREPERPPGVLVVGPGPWRWIADQRDGLYPRYHLRLRSLGEGTRLHRLELGRGPAILQEIRGFRRAGRAIARQGRAARRLATARHAPACIRLHGTPARKWV